MWARKKRLGASNYQKEQNVSDRSVEELIWDAYENQAEDCAKMTKTGQWKYNGRGRRREQTKPGRRPDGIRNGRKTKDENEKKNVEKVRNAGSYKSKDVGTNGDEYR